ncbi:BCCT family transporter [Aeromicrobium sp. SMF47]|uniref:BCCT family transporter n=1 Tax=Aeromicrobium yanjiei TaxID=2662028 RepID=A0A5Q2MBB3_9ACTN|nr:MULTISPECIES: BCCT family transporter [Aeromicrobium]MRJ75168.1 BCCT family transporter [Aeromicrobium yanjiei]MRK02775.1 BCCT family transporter [Aeromicrobium sp. S22]QGG40377.1 BCCT family transporter [Aeromicrobium yanjiei]
MSQSSTRTPWRERIDPIVFGVTAVIAVAFVLWGLISTSGLGSASSSAQKWVITNTGWLFVLASTFFVIFVIWLAASKYGRIPLGDDEEVPEFRTVSWVAMMFSAGMGIGLMFWGVAEPLSHYASPPPGMSEAESDAAMQTAMATTMFHWGLHPWAIYAVVGIAIAYGTFRKGRSQLISSAFAPLIGKRRAAGPIGRVIDVLAIFATLFGSAASLGLGALQIGSGLQYNGWVDNVGKVVLVVIIVVLTIAFIASAVSGVAKGIQWLSNTNMVLALVLALFVFVAGPTLLILNLLPTALGDYVSQMTEMASRTAASGDAAMEEWLAGWTIFYWAWWVSWTPFVGMFIARISRGRTIRQFVTGVLLVPTLVSLVWFAIFGGTAIDVQRRTGDLIDKAGAVDTDSALFAVLDHLPIAGVSTVLVMVLVGIFFVSGADAAAVVMGTLSEKGSIEPSRRTVVFWGAVMGGVAAIMLVVGGDDALNGLQQITIVAAVPFVLVMIALCIALYKDLQTDPMVVRGRLGRKMVETAVVTGVEEHDGEFVLVVERAEEEEPQ